MKPLLPCTVMGRGSFYFPPRFFEVLAEQALSKRPFWLKGLTGLGCIGALQFKFSEFRLAVSIGCSEELVNADGIPSLAEVPHFGS